MEFVVIDLDGATLDTFSSESAVRRFLHDNLATDPHLADDLAVLRYEHGDRIGPPLTAEEFLATSGSAVLSVATVLQGHVRKSTVRIISDSPGRHDQVTRHVILKIGTPYLKDAATELACGRLRTSVPLVGVE